MLYVTAQFRLDRNQKLRSTLERERERKLNAKYISLLNYVPDITELNQKRLKSD